MKVIRVKHIKNYLLEVFFDNGNTMQISLKNFLFSATNPMTTKFIDIELFKSVRIEHGHLSWGDNEMDLSAENLLGINSLKNISTGTEIMEHP